MDLIRTIRKEYGLDFISDDAQASSAIQNLTQNLEHACRCLSEDLYSKTTHFVLELLQNADDNLYPEGETPTLMLQLSGTTLVVWCNERGFNAQDVRAICSIGKSTKSGLTGYIGEKGIGFKSVFTVADMVSIWSREYSFMFDKREKLGMIAPIWLADSADNGGWTCFSLELSPQTNRGELVSRLSDIQPSLLLFLRKLHCIEVDINGNAVRLEKNLADGITRIQLTRVQDHVPLVTSQYILYSRAVQTHAKEEKRQGVIRSEIVLAFPILNTGEPAEQEQDVHAFLPLRPYGFRFVIQADFLTASNREDILTDRPWNRVLRDQIPGAVVNAINQLRQRPDLTYSWIRYLHVHTPEGFFQAVHTNLISALQRTPILLSSEGVLCRPAQVLILPSRFRDEDSADPLVASKYLGSNYYLNKLYDTSKDAAVFAELGVKAMCATDFLDGLFGMQCDKALSTQGESWWETVSGVLQGLIRQGHRERVQSLPIVPLASGHWVSAADDDIFFNSALVDIPQDLELKLVKSLNTQSSIYRLLQDLGVKEANPTKVAERIAVLHWRTPVHKLARTVDLASHARFLFRHWSQLDRRTFHHIWVITDTNRVLHPVEVYMNYPTHTTPALRHCLRDPTAPFLHSVYDSLPWTESSDDLIAWKDWLHTELGVHISPRLEDTGLSQEFREFTRRASTTELLLFLREYSEDMSSRLSTTPAALQELCDMQVTTSNGTQRPLNLTYLPRGALSQLRDLPFLPIVDPEDRRWDFLARFGVSLQVDGGLYLKELVRLSEAPLVSTGFFDETLAKARALYKQLEARFEVEGLAEAVRQNFMERSLIYLPARAFGRHGAGEWTSSNDSAVVWEGPPSMQTRIALKDIYPELHVFFRAQLSLPPCPDDIFLQELQVLHTTYNNRSLDTSAQVRIHRILCDLDASLLSMGKEWTAVWTPGWLNGLKWLPFVPTELPSGEVVLKSLQDDIYLPDLTGNFARLFRGRVAMVAAPPEASGGTLLSLYRLLTSEWLVKVKTLESHVVRRIDGVGTGEGLMDVPLSVKYRSRMGYIQRYALTVVDRDDAAAIGTFLRRLQDIKVYSVQADFIDHIYDLSDVTVTEQHPIGVNTTETSCTILIGRACAAEERDTLVSLELARLCPAIRATDIITVLTQPLRALDALYPMENSHTSSTPPALAQDISFAQSVPHTGFTNPGANHEEITFATTTSPNPHIEQDLAASDCQWKAEHQPFQTPSELLSVADGLDNLTLSPASSANNRLASGLVADDSIEPKSRQSPPHRGTREGSQRDRLSAFSHSTTFETLSTSSVTSETEDLAEQLPTDTRHPSLPPTEEQEYAGVLGEIAAYEHFESQLPGFKYTNWTSELRTHREFPPFRGTSIADFVYRDTKGILTLMLFDSAHMNGWRGKWPTYYLEVKATSGQPGEPFHMSPAQMTTAFRMRLLGNSAPQNVYVLVRVSSVRSQPIVQMYPDPWRLLCEGRMRHVSDVDMVLA